MPLSIEDEIRQTRPFGHPSARALVSLLRTATVLEHEENEALRPYGLTGTQYNVLRILRGAGRRGLCGREVGERLISRVPDVSRLLDRMAETGLISRARDAADRRHMTARIAPKGRRLLAETTPLLDALARARFDRLAPAALARLVDALAVVREPP
jgi:DNA-binding MarR family transcriptional regulator